MPGNEDQWKYDFRRQLEDSGLSINQQRTIEAMVSILRTETRRAGFSLEQRDEIIKAVRSFDTTGRLEPLTPRAEIKEDSAKWESARPGNLYVRETVRDKRTDRVGVVTAIRNGIVYVRYTDESEENLTGIGSARYRVTDLEKRIQ